MWLTFGGLKEVGGMETGSDVKGASVGIEFLWMGAKASPAIT
jgi:hypothetical protein